MQPRLACDAPAVFAVEVGEVLEVIVFVELVLVVDLLVVVCVFDVARETLVVVVVEVRGIVLILLVGRLLLYRDEVVWTAWQPDAKLRNVKSTDSVAGRDTVSRLGQRALSQLLIVWAR